MINSYVFLNDVTIAFYIQIFNWKDRNRGNLRSAQGILGKADPISRNKRTIVTLSYQNISLRKMKRFAKQKQIKIF